MLVGWIAIAAVALEAIGLAVGLVVWGWPALIIVGPLLLTTVIMTVVLWLTVVPQRMLRAHVEGVLPPGASGGWRAAEDLRGFRSRSGPGADPGASGSAWPSDGGFVAGHMTHHGWHDPSDSGWPGGGASSESWSDSTSSGSSDSSSSGSSDSSSSGSSDSSSSSG